MARAAAGNIKSTAEWFAKNVIFTCLCWKTEIVSNCSTYNPKCYLYYFYTTQSNERTRFKLTHSYLEGFFTFFRLITPIMSYFIRTKFDFNGFLILSSFPDDAIWHHSPIRTKKNLFFSQNTA